MLTLSLLLGAAAGVNAILGGSVMNVKISENLYICANGCAYEGAYFDMDGFYCPLEEVVRVEAPEGIDDLLPPDTPYQCAGVELSNGLTERPRRDGEEPFKCTLARKNNQCLSTKSSGGSENKETTEWLEVVEELKKAKAQNAQSSPEKPSPAPKEPAC
ncbi:hypothetical protein NHJ13051_004756 [Beauveria bassiana]